MAVNWHILIAVIFVLDTSFWGDPLEVLTYNTWLHESGLDAFTTKESRKARIIQSLKESDADVVCLQEVFSGKDVEEIVNGVKDEFQYSFSNIHTDINDLPPQATVPPCGAEPFSTLISCLVYSGCDDSADIVQFSNCFYDNCRAYYDNLLTVESQECISCFWSSLLNPASCVNGAVDAKTVNVGGLLLLSRHSLGHASYNEYFYADKTATGRGFIHARAERLWVFCTHLEAVLPGARFYEPNLSKYGIESFKEKNRAEVRMLMKFRKDFGPSLVMGDLNTGLALKSPTKSKARENYMILLKRMTTNSVLECTYCEPGYESILDHVFVKKLIIRNTKRIFVPDDWANKMSDHAGVQSEIVVP